MKCSCGLDYEINIRNDEAKMVHCSKCYENSWEAKRNREDKEIKEWIVKSLDDACKNTLS